MNQERIGTDPMNLGRAWVNRPNGVYIPGENGAGNHSDHTQNDYVYRPAKSNGKRTRHDVPEHCQ